MTENNETDPAETRSEVREQYAAIADNSGSCCDSDTVEESTDSSCGSDTALDKQASKLGYDEQEIATAVEGANLGLGCGNPKAIAELEAGETVLDLGSGAGFDCFLAAEEVGPTGSVVGVDMTPEMIEKARENATEHDNVEFRLGEIEHLPVADGTVDVIISNCVINLSPEKSQVFREAYRVLEPGGRVAISDVVLSADLPAELTELSSVADCVGGAATVEALEAMLAEAGFTDIQIDPKEESEEFIRDWDDDHDPSEYIVSATIEAKKPADVA